MASMKLIVGLGNPGSEYSQTRHNLGAMVVDELVKQLGTSFANEPKLRAELASIVYNKQETVLIAKPTTFMNLSGDSVRKLMDYYKLSPDNIWVVSDDLDLEFGTVRVRIGGSSGGHNGLKDIIAKCGEGFVRFRVGIKNDLLDRVPADEFVLQKFDKSESNQLPTVVDQTAALIITSLNTGIEHSSQAVDNA
jgi:PTH1 family peptidyl-tRNA hydrolase